MPADFFWVGINANLVDNVSQELDRGDFEEALIWVKGHTV